MAKKKKQTEIMYAELVTEARQIIKEIDEDVEIYNKIKLCYGTLYYKFRFAKTQKLYDG